MASARSRRLLTAARYLSLALALAWAGVLFYLSSQPSIDTPMLFPGQDKLFHLIAYGILGFLAMGAMTLSTASYQHRQVWTVVIIVALYGLSDEIHQYYVPGRSADSLDLLADAIGGMLGAWIMFLLVSVYCRRSRSQPAAIDN